MKIEISNLKIKLASREFSKRLLSAVLTAQILLSAPLALANESASRAAAENRTGFTNILNSTSPGDLDANDQIMMAFANLSPESLPLPISATEPSLDQDPFFLRAQTWETTEKQSESSASPNGFNSPPSSLSFQNNRLLIPGAPRALHFQVPITPVHVTDDFVFFTLNSNSDLFKKAAGDEPTGEGLFFIPRAELLSRAIDNQPIPIFFFPLAGQGWTGAVQSFEFHETETLAVQNSMGESVAIELRDVETAMKAQQVNLLMATALTAQNSSLSQVGAHLLPAPGSTAAFGLFFTGLDLNHPGQSLFATNTGLPSNPNSGLSNAQKFFAQADSHFWKAPAGLIQKLVGSKPAQAWSPPPDLVNRLIYVSSILTGMLAVSVVLKYAHPGIRLKLKSIRRGEEPTTLAGKAKREVSEIFSVFAHVTTVSAQIAPVGMATAVEIFLDRFAPSVAAADHTLVRRFLKKSYYFARDTMQNSPVNAKTFVLGALVMGSVDTTFLVVQYEWAIPAISHLISPLFGQEGQAKIAAAFDANNPNFGNLVINDSIRTALYYLLNGASSFSIDSRAQIIDGIIKEAEGEMRAQGIDPSNPQNLAGKLRRVETKVNVILKSRGLPSADDFLFDASTLIKKGSAVLGFKGTAEIAAKESFILSTRFALSQNALKRAIQQAEKYAVQSPSTEATDTLALLKETLGNMSFISAIPRGREGFAKALQTRQELTILSYEGPIDWMVRYVPETWAKAYSPAAAQAASLLFRQSLYSFLSSDKMALLEAPTKDVREFLDLAEKQVTVEMQKDHSELQSLTGTALVQAIDAKYKLEKSMRLQLEITRLSRERAKAATDAAYRPTKGDWLARRQEKKAQSNANDRLGIYILAHPEANTQEQINTLWRGYYREALARQVGLHLESREAALARGDQAYIELLDQTEASATVTTQNQIKNDKGLSDYLEKLSAPDKLRIQSSIYANNFLQAYKNNAVDSGGFPGLHSQQPGATQRIRQTRFARESRVLTRSLRLMDSFVDDTALQTGWHAALSRNVPLYSDLWSSHIRLSKSFLPAMTTGYLWSYYAWQVHMSYGTYGLVMLLSAVGVSTPSQWLNRAFRMNEIKAMDSILPKLLYAIPYSWVTFFGMIPATIFASDANRIYSDYVREPVLSVFGQIPHVVWLETAGAAGLVATVAHPKVRGIFSDLGRRLMDLVSGAQSLQPPTTATTKILNATSAGRTVPVARGNRSCIDLFATAPSQ